jgi:kynurenine formamidase
MTEPDEYPRNLVALRAGADRHIGAAGFIDHAARIRGARSVALGRSVSIARTITPIPSLARDGRPNLVLQKEITGNLGALAHAEDRLDVACHGEDLTHIDAMNHLGYDGNWFPGVADFLLSPGIEAWSDTGFVTRGVLFDIPRTRGCAYIKADNPVTSDELDDIEAAFPIDVQRGDAVLLYAGRDQFDLRQTTEASYAAVDASVARWLADRGVSVLCWDMCDLPREDDRDVGPHHLIWAMGLAIVDNCDFAQLVPTMRSNDRYDGMFIAAPLPLVGATGSLVNPLIVL